jgi:hypothetical protein
MIKRALALLWFLASPALAVPVEVTSGEHDGFTRIVLNFGAQIDWEFGRTIDGYRFRPIDKDGAYDLRPVFDKIGKSRLAAISVNAETSELDIDFACACHAIPFEFRPGIIVIDLRDGPPPKGSSFEEPLQERFANTNLPDLAAEQKPTAENDGFVSPVATYNWLDQFSKPAPDTSAPIAKDLAPMPSTTPDMQPLRDQLLRQLSRGATDGVIDLAIPKTDQPVPPKAEVEAARVALGELGGVSTKTVRTADTAKGAQGTLCTLSEDLKIAAWGNSDPISLQLAADMTQLSGEFDEANPEAVTRAAQTRLFLGFGLEARQILQAFPSVATNEPILQSLSYIVDGEADPMPAFAGQGACNTSAALWASLSDPDITQISQIDTKAVILAFSALPNHLRDFIGPLLVDRILRLGDEDTASTLRNIVLRANTEVSDEMAVMQAEVDLAKGDAASAEKHLENAQDGVSFTTAKALIALVDARVNQGLPIEKETVTALESMQSEMADAEIGAQIAVALIHAKAASGDFAAAFVALADYPAEAAKVWQVLAKLGDDSAFLSYAITPPSQPIANLETAVVTGIAQRLLDLGMPENALTWMAQGGITEGQLLAQIHVARKDGATALAALQGDDTPQAAELRATAQSLLGDHAAAAKTLAPLSEPSEVRALALAQDWQTLADRAPSQWSALAQNLIAAPTPAATGVDTFGPLARGLSLADQSAATRAEIEKLLGGLPAPTPDTP